MFSKYTAIGFMACASGGSRPQSSQLLVDESNEDWDGGPVLSEQPGLHSGDKRPFCSRQQSKQARKKMGKMQYADMAFANIASIMID